VRRRLLPLHAPSELSYHPFHRSCLPTPSTLFRSDDMHLRNEIEGSATNRHRNSLIQQPSVVEGEADRSCSLYLPPHVMERWPVPTRRQINKTVVNGQRGDALRQQCELMEDSPTYPRDLDGGCWMNHRTSVWTERSWR
jgi:hypothetical protein